MTPTPAWLQEKLFECRIVFVKMRMAEFVVLRRGGDDTHAVAGRLYVE